MDTKLVIVVRTKYKNAKGETFKPRTGKLMGQVGHAVQYVLTRNLRPDPRDRTLDHLVLTEVEKSWLTDKKSAKIVCQVETLEELLALNEDVEANGMQTHIVTDLGLTEFDGPTETVLVIGPDLAEKIDPFTKHLKLL